MCEGEPGVAEALAMLDRALGTLADVDAGSLPAAVQAEVLRALERAQSRHTAAHARVLSVFMAQDGCAADGQGTAGAWLRWQTRVSRPAAAALVGWARRLEQHPGIAAALAGGDMSASWAKTVCGWTDLLPAEKRAGADQILVDAAAGGADLADLAGLAGEMYRRSAGPDTGGDDGFDDRHLNLGVTWRGAGRVAGDLTPGCAAALTAVIEALSKKAGPEDTRTAAQRRHDALEEACRRLIAAGMVPGRAGQPAHVLVHMTLSQLRDLPGAVEAEAEWAAARACEPGWLTGPEAEAAACDASVIPVVTGRPDDAALDRLAHEFLAGGDAAQPATDPASASPASASPASASPASASPASARPASARPDPASPDPASPDPASPDPASPDPASPGGSSPGGSSPGGSSPGGSSPGGSSPGGSSRGGSSRGGSSPDTASREPAGPEAACEQAAGLEGAGLEGASREPAGAAAGRARPLTDASRQRLRRALLRLAAGALSGPGGLAAWLRTGLAIPGLATPSLPLDIGTASELIPAHLRRAATTRHRHCAFPGCRQPASTCQIHHLIPRRDGGPTSLHNLLPLCTFHHLTAIHRWGWRLTLNTDGTTTATSPDGTRVLHSHGPPAQAA